MFNIKKLMFVPVAFVLALLPCESRGQQTGTFSNLNLKKTGSAAGAYAFQFSGSSGILKAHNAAGAETSSWNPETGHFSGTVDLDLSECFILSEDNTVTGNNDFQGENRFANSIELYDSGVSPYIDFDGATLTYDGSVENFAFSKNVNAPTFSGSGSNLTNLNANNISSGEVSKTRLPGDVAYTTQANTFTADQRIESSELRLASPGGAYLTFEDTTEENIGSITYLGNVENLSSNGRFFINKPIGDSLTVAADELPGFNFEATDWEDSASFIFNGDSGYFFADKAIEAPSFYSSGYVTANYLSGNGSSITNLNGANITSGQIPQASVDGMRTWTGEHKFTSPFNTFTGTFTGSGAALNALKADKLASGTVPDARLSSNVPLKNAANTFTGQVTFNGGVVANVRALSGAGTHNILNTDYHLLIDVGAGNVTYNFPAATLGKSFIFITSNNGGSNTITFKAVTGENINTPTTFDNTWVSTPGSPSKRVYYVTCFFPGQWMITSYQPLTT